MTKEEQENILKIIPRLSHREYQVFMWAGDGKSVKEMSVVPGHHCSVKSIDTHMAHIKQKFGFTGYGASLKVREYAARYRALVDLGHVKESDRSGAHGYKHYREIQLCLP